MTTTSIGHRKVIDVVAKDWSIACLMDDGGVIGIGQQSDARTMDDLDFNNLTALADLSNVAQIALGSWHGMALLRNGSVRNFGNNEELVARLDNAGPPTAFGALKQISAGVVNVGLFANGYIHAWPEGAYTAQLINNRRMELADSKWVSDNYAVNRNDTLVLLFDDSGYRDILPPPELDGKVEKVITGGVFSTVKLLNGSWRTFGGFDDPGHRPAWDLPELRNLKELVPGGHAFSVAHFKNGTIKGYANTTDWYGWEEPPSVTVPKSLIGKLGKPVKVVAGASYYVILFDTGRIFVWGDNHNVYWNTECVPDEVAAVRVPKTIVCKSFNVAGGKANDERWKEGYVKQGDRWARKRPSDRR